MCGVSSDCLALGVALTGILEEAGRLGSVPAGVQQCLTLSPEVVMEVPGQDERGSW